MGRAALDLFTNALAWASEGGQTSTANGGLLIKPTGISHLFHELRQCLRSIKRQPALHSVPFSREIEKKQNKTKGTRNIHHRTLNDSHLTPKLLFPSSGKMQEELDKY